MKNIENSLLIPTADPIIEIVMCDTCKGTGTVEFWDCTEDECYGEKGCEKCFKVQATCDECDGHGEVEIWR